MNCFCQEKIQECIVMLEAQVMDVLNDQTLDKYQKNLRIQPLSSKKKILLNTIESIQLVESQTKKDR